MQFRKIIAMAKLTGQGTPERDGSTGATAVGDQSQASCPDEAVVIYREVHLCGIGNTVVMDIETLAFTGSASYVAPTAQVSSVTVVGTITLAGNVKVTMGAHFGGVIYLVPVLLADNATAVAGKIRTYLAARLGAGYEVGGTGAVVTVARVIETVYGYANDATMSVRVENDTATGLTLANSTVTEAGVVASGVLVNTTDAVDAEGLEIPVASTPEILAYMLRVPAGQVGCLDDGTAKMITGEFCETWGNVESDGGGVLVWQHNQGTSGSWTIDNKVAYSQVVLTFALTPQG